MRKTTRVYTEDTYHGEAPEIDSEEAKMIMEKDPEVKEYIEKTKSQLNETN